MGFRDGFKPSNPPPCYGCQERVLHCHSNCGKYAEFKAKEEAINQARAEYKKGISNICVSGINRCKV